MKLAYIFCVVLVFHEAFFVASMQTKKNHTAKGSRRIDESGGSGEVFDKIMEINSYAIEQFGDIFKQTSYQEKNKLVVKRLYDTYLYPDADILIADFIKNKNIPDYFADNIRGRIVPLNEVAGVTHVVEYIYGFIVKAGLQFSKIEYVETFAEKNKVFFRIDGLFTRAAISNATFNLTQTGRFTFNKNSQVESFDVNILNPGKLLNSMDDHRSREKIICNTHEQYCTGPNKQYSNSYDCSDFLIGIPEGTWDIAKSNTVVCRQFHSYMAMINPDYHCTHIGPSGGGICADHPYEAFYRKFF